MMHVYAPTSSSIQEEIEIFYENISKALTSTKIQFLILMGDFNAKVGHKEDETEVSIGNGYGERNKSGTKLIEFAL